MIQFGYGKDGPFYKQIKKEIKKMLAAGSEGERLPSVGELSSRLAVNPHAAEQAYRELEEEGYLRLDHGEAYVKENAASFQKHELLEQFDRVVTELCILSVEPKELERRLNRLAEGEKNFD